MDGSGISEALTSTARMSPHIVRGASKACAQNELLIKSACFCSIITLPSFILFYCISSLCNKQMHIVVLILYLCLVADSSRLYIALFVKNVPLHKSSHTFTVTNELNKSRFKYDMKVYRSHFSHLNLYFLIL